MAFSIGQILIIVLLSVLLFGNFPSIFKDVLKWVNKVKKLF